MDGGGCVLLVCLACLGMGLWEGGCCVADA